MMGEKKMFTSYVKNRDSQDTIIFGDGNQGKVKGLGKIAITTEHSISNVFLVESLGYNLLSVSQLCHMGYNCLFTNIDVFVFRRSDGSLAFKGVLDGKLYLVDFSKENADLDACLIAKTNMGWCWSEGRNATLRSKSPLFSRCSDRQSRKGHPSLHRHQTKTGDEGIPQCGLVQLRGPRAIRPIVTGPAWPPRVTGLTCKGIPVITVCNPALWEYFRDNLGS
jgi:hypothetical protein